MQQSEMKLLKHEIKGLVLTFRSRYRCIIGVLQTIKVLTVLNEDQSIYREHTVCSLKFKYTGIIKYGVISIPARAICCPYPSAPIYCLQFHGMILTTVGKLHNLLELWSYRSFQSLTWRTIVYVRMYCISSVLFNYNDD